MVILDTDLVSLLQWGDGKEAERLRQRLAALPPEQVATTIITYEEQTRGWLAYTAKAKTLAQQVEAYRRLELHLQLYRVIPVLEFGRAAAVEYQRLSKLRLRVGTMDLRIAAIALSTDALLLTRNQRDFRLVPDFSFEDWSG